MRPVVINDGTAGSIVSGSGKQFTYQNKYDCKDKS